MTTAAYSLVDHPSAWQSADLASPSTWTATLPGAVRDEILAAAVQTGDTSNDAIAGRSIDRAALPAAAAWLAPIEREIVQGRGFVLLRGLDPSLDDGRLKRCYWIIANLLGRPLSQNSYGERLCDVMDLGRRIGEKRVREYQTNADLKFHTDRTDIVGLLCVRKAMAGGRSAIASAVSAYNALVRTRPDLLGPLFAGMPYMNLEEGGDSSFTRRPIFALADGVLSCRYQRNTLDTAMRHGAPYSAADKAALAELDRLAASPALRLDMDLQRGDIQLINNYTILHARTAFEDFPEPHLKRCMCRVWLAMAERRPLGPGFEDYGGVPVTLMRPAS